MKIVCDFCKTEYSVPSFRGGTVQCAVCGNSWRIHTPRRRGALLTVFAGLCAVLAALIFAVVSITQHQANVARANPLVTSIDAIRIDSNAEGVSHFVVDGRVINRSDEIYGVPDLLIISYDDNNRVVARQRFMPSATLLDAGASAVFSHVLSVPVDNVKKIEAQVYYNNDRSNNGGVL